MHLKSKFKHNQKYLVIVLLIPLCSFSIHKYYISLCEVEYVEKKQSVQIIIGLFIDDLEVTLNKEHQTQLYLASEREITNIDTYYKNYLTNHLKFKINQKNQQFQYIGKEYDDNLVRFYLEIPAIKTLETIEIENTCLFKEFPDQQNITKIKNNKFNKTFYFTKNNVKGLLKFLE